MIPYVGCKRFIARDILSVIPSATHFYDLFGGGGSVTEFAYTLRENGIFGNWQKWRYIHYNELKTGVYELNKLLWSNSFKFDDDIDVDKERFNYVKRNDFTAINYFILSCYSYANMGLHYFNSPAKTKYNIKRIMKTKPIDVICSNKDYRTVHIEPDSVVYCDIPYVGVSKYKKGIYYGVKFDYAAFYNYAFSADYPVYFSDYCAPDYFKLVFAKKVICRLSLRCRSFRTEKLFWNGVKNER